MSNELIRDISQHSVTKDEVNATKPSGGFVRYVVGFSNGGISTVLKSLPDLPPQWSTARDDILASTVLESHWAQAVGISIMKLVSRSWDIDGNVPFLRKERARTIIRGYDYVGQISKGFADYLLRDNGWWIEVVRASGAAGSRVLGLNYLPSNRCWPTGNPDIPVIYWDRLGKYHELRAHEVIRFVDCPDGSNVLGVGMCAARRAYNDIRSFASVMRYRLEKITGARPLSLYFVTGVTKEQIESAQMSADEARLAKGVVAFGGASIIPFMQRDGISMVEIPLAALPDQFNYKEEVQETDFAYANALPLVISLDLRAMTGQRAGTGSQSQVIDDHAVVKEAVLNDIAQKFNNEDVWHLLPSGTTFYFVRNDLADKIREADIVTSRVNAASTMVAKMQLDPERAIEWLANENIVPKAWAQSETGEGTTVSDADGPSEPNGNAPSVILKAPEAVASARGASPNPNVTAPAQVATKEQGDADVQVTDIVRLLELGMQIGKKQTQPEGATTQFHMHLPDTLTHKLEMRERPAPIVNITNEVHPSAIPVTVNVPVQPAPITPVTVNLPETQVTVQSASPDIHVHAPEVEEETKTIDVAKRDANGFLEQLVQRTRRTFKK